MFVSEPPAVVWEHDQRRAVGSTVASGGVTRCAGHSVARIPFILRQLIGSDMGQDGSSAANTEDGMSMGLVDPPEWLTQKFSKMGKDRKDLATCLVFGLWSLPARSTLERPIAAPRDATRCVRDHRRSFSVGVEDPARPKAQPEQDIDERPRRQRAKAT